MAEKLNPEVTEHKEADAQKKQTIAALFREIVTLKDHAGWIALKTLLERKLQVAEYVLENYERYDPRALDKALCQRQDMTYIIETVEDAEANAANLAFELKRMHSDIEARRAQHAKQQ